MKFHDGDRVRHITKGHTGTVGEDTVQHAGSLCYEVHWDNPVKAFDPEDGEELITTWAYTPERCLESMKQKKGENWENIWGDGAT